MYTAQQNFRVSVVLGAILLAGAFVVNFLAIYIATNNASVNGEARPPRYILSRY